MTGSTSPTPSGEVRPRFNSIAGRTREEIVEILSPAQRQKLRRLGGH